MSRKNNSLMVPEAAYAMEQLKYEIAQELGIPLPQDGYWGYMTTKDVGKIGGNITKRLIQIAEQEASISSLYRF